MVGFVIVKLKSLDACIDYSEFCMEQIDRGGIFHVNDVLITHEIDIKIIYRRYQEMVRFTADWSH